MIVTIGGIPVYDAVISDEETGMFKISLVDDPAVMSNFLAFDANHKFQLYSITDEEKRLVRGCIMRADFPIYREDNQMGQYYVIYKSEQIRTMAEKYLAESRQNSFSLMHQTDAEGIQMVQYFIKGGGVSVEGFDECADGSLFGEFHIINDDIWAEIKAGTYKGFSLEGVFDLVPEQKVDEVQEIVDVLDGAFSKLFKSYKNMSKLSKFKASLARILAEFGNITTDKGILAWDGEEDLKIGDALFVEDAEGNRTPAEDGDYKTDDNRIIVVADGKVAEIKDAEVAPAPTEAPIEENVPEANDEEASEGEGGEGEGGGEGDSEEESTETTIGDQDRKIKELEKRIKELEEENASLRAEIAELKAKNEEMSKMSLARPAHTEVKEGFRTQKTGVRGLDNLGRILGAK